MRRLKLRRPSPAFVLASIALFVSLGGTGYAASRLTDGTGQAQAAKHKPAAKSLTTSQVNKLIAAYYKKHHSSLVGPKGSTGATGARGGDGGQGPAGPGAQKIAATGSSAVSGAQPLTTIGPWALTLTCSASGPNASIVIRGPGTLTETTSIGTANGGAGQLFVGNGSVASGFTSAVNTGGQIALDGFLQNGATTYELHLQTTATNGGLFETCDVVGDAIPVS